MRTPQSLPIRRVFRGTDWHQPIPNPRDYPISPAIEQLLSQPAWSVRSLLPTSEPLESSRQPRSARTSNATSTAQSPDEITPQKLHHLLKLSALPRPKSAQEESRMLKTLRSQIHFVKAIQSVDTKGVEPLVTIRDETREAIEEQTITLEKMMPYLELEEKMGRNGTVRRRDVERTEQQDRAERATWEIDVADLGVGSAERRKGKFFYVKKVKEKEEEEAQEAGSRTKNTTKNKKKPSP